MTAHSNPLAEPSISKNTAGAAGLTGPGTVGPVGLDGPVGRSRRGGAVDAA